MKHDILSVKFPAGRSDYLIVAGADQNVRCGMTNSKARKAAVNARDAHSAPHSRYSSGAS